MQAGRSPAACEISASRYPPATRGKLVVWGLLASRPFGGMTWQAMHYVVGLRRLGFDVWYVEDSDRTVLDPVRFWPTTDCAPNVEYLAKWMRRAGLEDRWAFRPPGDRRTCIGLSGPAALAELYEEADAVLNLCGAQELRDDHAAIRRLVYVQTDPTADQVRVATGDEAKKAELDAYDCLFTYGENLGAADCLVPTSEHAWHPTRPPVCVDWWTSAAAPPPRARLTTITNWLKSPDNDVVWGGEVWRWNKQDGLRRFVGLPARSSLPLGVAVGAIDEEDQAFLRSHGWELTLATALGDPEAYRDYIVESAGELSPAKEQYVRPRTGWFSDRSVCYLAAGRPVIAQDTGFGKFVPTGEGLFTFNDEEEALVAIDAVARDPGRHRAAALDIAREYFAAERVLGAMLRTAGLS